uniref:Exocyst complex component Sec6 n=1 Tax=Echinostoma caproni TaxID=27848 RepID=A0A183BA17_9TREM
LENLTDSVAVEFIVAEYSERLQKLWYNLMKNEMILVEQLEEVIKEFELNITDMIQGFLEKTEEHFTECRELQSQFNERLVDTCPVVLERFLRNDSDLVASEALYAVSNEFRVFSSSLWTDSKHAD